MMSGDPTQVQLNFMLLAFVLEILFYVIILLYRHRLGFNLFNLFYFIQIPILCDIFMNIFSNLF